MTNIDLMKANVDNIDIDIKYSTERNDIINDFYNVVIPKSKEYKRAVGYFSSHILKEYMKGLSEFYSNDGKMKLIISPELSSADINVLRSFKDPDDISRIYNELMEQTLESYLKDESTKDSAELFFLLLKEGVLKVKIAVPKNGIGIFHEKIGVFTLNNNEKIAIIGSNNETFRSVGANHESFNTFCSWKAGQNEYIQDHEEEFDRYWNNRSLNLNVYNMRESFKENIFKRIDQEVSIKERMQIIDGDKINEYQRFSEKLKLKFVPYSYQYDAVKALISNKKGILEFATGSGKTKTAIAFLENIKFMKVRSFTVIVVPDKTLMEQWHEELSEYNNNILKCYSENNGWAGELRRLIDIHNSGEQSKQLIIVTNQTMFRGGENSRFLKLLSKVKEDTILVVDEIHNWSTKNITDNMPTAEYMLGLSATPFNNPKTEMDNKIDVHFNGIIAHYGLEEAIRDKKLVPYNYYPVFVKLNEQEQEYYSKVTSEIAKLQSMYDNTGEKEILKRLELKRYERSRIIYGAAEKISKLKSMLLNDHIEKKDLLIYCGATNYYEDVEAEKDNDITITQLQAINNMITNIGIKSAQYTQKETSKERLKNIELFEEGILSTLVAIKCLDEGVDIPQIKNAVILASSSNHREYVQRRGRVLRKTTDKDYSNIYDFVVYDPDDNDSHLNMLERSRVLEFNSLAINKNDNIANYNDYLEGEVYGKD